MLKKQYELTLNHLGLGTLNECALLLLFANTEFHRILADTDGNPDTIYDSAGYRLYPAYYYTKLDVPPPVRLSDYQIWDTVEVGVDVKRFGEIILDVKGIMGSKGEIPDETENWNRLALPTFEAGNLMVIDAREDAQRADQLSSPAPACISKMERVKTPPRALLKTKKKYVHRPDATEINELFASKEPILFNVEKNRDAITDRHMIFAKFTEIMDVAENTHLTRCLAPAFPDEILHNLSILKREVYYYGNCFPGETIEVHIKGIVTDFNAGEAVSTDNGQIIGKLILYFELYQHNNFNFLATAKAEKIITDHSGEAALQETFDKLRRQYG